MIFVLEEASAEEETEGNMEGLGMEEEAPECRKEPRSWAVLEGNAKIHSHLT